MRKVVLCSLAILGCLFSFGREPFQITAQLFPSVEMLRFRRDSLFNLNDIYGPKLSYNFGMEYKTFLSPGCSFSIGLLYQNKGFRNENFYRLSGDTTRYQGGFTVGSFHMISIPTDLNWHIKLKRKTHLLITTGITNGYALLQATNGKGIPNEAEPENTFFEVKNGRNRITGVFKNYYFGANFGVGITQYIKSKLVLIVTPMYRRQLNNAFNPDQRFTRIFTAGLDSYSIDFKVGYYFTKQIRNRSKDF